MKKVCGVCGGVQLHQTSSLFGTEKVYYCQECGRRTVPVEIPEKVIFSVFVQVCMSLEEFRFLARAVERHPCSPAYVSLVEKIERIEEELKDRSDESS